MYRAPCIGTFPKNKGGFFLETAFVFGDECFPCLIIIENSYFCYFSLLLGRYVYVWNNFSAVIFDLWKCSTLSFCVILLMTAFFIIWSDCHIGTLLCVALNDIILFQVLLCRR